MTRFVQACLFITLVWLPFSVACIASVPISLYGILFTQNDYARNVLRSMDKLLAALMGFTGRWTLSAELGAGSKFQWLRRGLDSIQKDHCAKAARDEGLI